MIAPTASMNPTSRRYRCRPVATMMFHPTLRKIETKCSLAPLSYGIGTYLTLSNSTVALRRKGDTKPHAQDADRHAGAARDRAGEHAFRRREGVGRRELDGRWQRADRRRRAHLHLRRQGVFDEPIGLAVVQKAGHRVLAVTHELDGEVEAVRGRIGRDVEVVAIVAIGKPECRPWDPASASVRRH
jgi:hypothetical protein